MGLTLRTEITSLELDGADGALLRGDERAHVLLGPGERSLRRLAQEGLVPVVGSRLIFVQGVYGRDAGQRDEREEEACRRPTGAHGSMRTRRHRFGRMRMRRPRARSVVALGHPLQDYIAFAEQKTSPVTESSATAAREPPHRRAAPQDFTRLGTNAMSGPGVYEPGEEYVPAGIKPLVDEGSLPVAPAAGGEELWLIQIPHDADPADLDGLRFKISDEDAGPEISQFKAGGKF